MAVVAISTKAGSWDGGSNSERNGLLYEVVRRRYKMTKLVRVSHPGDGPAVILASVGIPKIGDSYALFNDADILATCIDVKPRPTNNPLLWEVDCMYDTDRVVASVTDHPLSQPADVRWTFVKYEKALLRTIDGVPCVTSSNEAYDPPMSWEDARPTCVITRNEASYSPSNAFQYHNVLNRETFATAPPTFARINYINGHQQFSFGIFYYQVTYEIEFCRESYATRILDQGFRDADGKLFRDPITFQALSNPTLLNGRGFARRDAVGALVGGIGSSDTTITFTNGNRFPPGTEPTNAYNYRGSGDDYFEIRIGDEVLQVTTPKPIVIGSFPDYQVTLNVTRGYGGTTPASHGDGAVVTLEPYYKRYLTGNGVKSFSPLSLPSV